MVICGADLHKRGTGRGHRRDRPQARREDGPGHAGRAPRAAPLGSPVPERRWALEDCRHLSRRLEVDLLRSGEAVVRVPPTLMAGVRRSVREPGKSDPIDALAVAQAALREPDLPVATLEGPSASCGCWSTTARTSSPSAPAPAPAALAPARPRHRRARSPLA